MIRHLARWMFALLMVSVAVATLYFSIANSSDVAENDFSEYWASGKLLLSHRSPYDEAGVLALERAGGAPLSHAQIMFNPPCVLPLTIPLGVLSIRHALLLWELMTVGGLILSIRLLSSMYGDGGNRLHLLGYLFAPVVAAVELGQILPLALLGLVVFLRFYKERPWLAGLAVPLLAIKPHLLLPFAAVVLLWAVRKRQYAFLGAAILSVVAASAIPCIFDPQVIAQYLPVLHSANQFSQQMPTLSSLLARVGPRAAHLQYLPAAIGVCASLLWYLRQESEWDWNRQGLLLIAISVVVAPYSWFEDEALVLPAVLSGIYLCTASGRSLLLFLILDGAALALVFSGVRLVTGAYLWTSLAWLAWVLYSQRGSCLIPLHRAEAG